MLPSTHPAPVLFPPVVQPLSAVGLVRCSQCYPVGYLGTIGGGGATFGGMSGAEVCSLFEFLYIRLQF